MVPKIGVDDSPFVTPAFSSMLDSGNRFRVKLPFVYFKRNLK